MKVKKYLSVWAMVCAGALTLAGCSDYDNGYNENAIKFNEAFKETFGDIDPDQDWNLAERATVTVSTQTTSDIKIYALRGDQFAIVGNYEGISGTQMLGVDVVEGTRALIVSDGRTAQTCSPGDVVVFNAQDTRTTHEGKTGIVTVSKLTAEKTYLPGDDETWYPKYRYSGTDEYTEVVENMVTEFNVNLHKVTNNFSYVSTGSFIVYPYYWDTSSKNTVGVYYYDSNNVRQEVPVYTIKEGDEIMFENALNGDNVSAHTEEATLENWTIDNGQSLALNTWSIEENGNSYGMQTPFVQYYVSGKDLPNATIHKTITGLTPGHYIVKLHARMFNEGDVNNQPAGITFFANGLEFPMSKWRDPYAAEFTYTNSGKKRSSYVRHGDIYLEQVKVETDGKLDLGFTISGAEGNWLAFKNLEVIKMGSYENPGDRNSYSPKYVRGQGIRVDIPAGTKFGMYLRSNDAITYYSESELNNDPAKYGKGVVYKGEGLMTDRSSWVERDDLYPCYASTFSVGDQMFLGFEDWAYPDYSDKDLNDVVLAFSGCTPTIINEDPETTTWMLACEDLGGTFDRDYNDVVFKVEHVSGQTTAKVTPMAAGGTLASYIFYVNGSDEQCLGEIHQLFGFEPAVSGEYTAHNVGASRGKEGTTVTINVPEDWSMAYYSTNTYGRPQGGSDEGYQNMGGFEIRTLTRGTDPIDNPQIAWLDDPELSSGASRIPAPDKGAAPYIICFPYSYTDLNTPENGWKTETFWAWTQEFITIDGCYPDFPKWVSNHGTNGEWYRNKNNNGATVSELKIVSSSGTNPVLQDPQLTANGDIYINRGGVPDFAGNVTSLSSGTITFRVDTPTGDVWTSGKSYWNAGDRTVYVTQEANGNYDAGSTQFVLHIAKDNTTLNVQNGSTTVGEGIDLKSLVTSTNSDASITYKVYNGDYLVETIVKGKDESCVFTPERTGTLTIKISQAANNNFNASEEKTCYVEVSAAQAQPTTLDYVLYFTDGSGNKWAASYYDGNFAQMAANTYNSYQQWKLEPAGDGYYYMYNVGAQQYLHLTTAANDSWNAIFQTDKPEGDHNGKFKIVEVNGGIALMLKSKETAGVDAYMGYDNIGDKAKIYLNKGEYNRIVFTTAAYNTNLAKKRSGKK